MTKVTTKKAKVNMTEVRKKEIIPKYYSAHHRIVVSVNHN